MPRRQAINQQRSARDRAWKPRAELPAVTSANYSTEKINKIEINTTCTSSSASSSFWTRRCSPFRCTAAAGAFSTPLKNRWQKDTGSMLLLLLLLLLWLLLLLKSPGASRPPWPRSLPTIFNCPQRIDIGTLICSLTLSVRLSHLYPCGPSK